MGDKYILELEDKPFHKEDGDFLYRVKGFNSLVFDMTGIGKLTPYTEPDLEQVRKEAYEKGWKEAEDHYEKGYNDGYDTGLEDAWKVADKIFDMPCLRREQIFSKCDSVGVWDILRKYSASEAIEKIRQYEQEKEEPKKEQSVTAEEVMRQYLDMFCKDGRSCTECPLHTQDFTCGRGRHFLTTTPVSDEEVRKAYAAVLQWMKENNDNK